MSVELKKLGTTQEHEDKDEEGDKMEWNENTRSMSMTSVESLERDQGDYKYLSVSWSTCIILENILEPSRTF